MNVMLKRAYESPATQDGKRVLVDRLWPRGVAKAEARIDLWLKDVAPSTALRQWFGHDPAKWTEFKKRYRAELKDNPAWRELQALARQGDLTLVYAAKDPLHNDAVVLKQLLDRSADWRAERLDRVRALIRRAAPQAVEEAKWKKPSNPAGVPTWSDHGLLCTGETYKDKIKLTFARGAALKDPHGLFNASLEAGVRRAIDLGPSDTLDEDAFLALVKAAVALNRGEASG